MSSFSYRKGLTLTEVAILVVIVGIVGFVMFAKVVDRGPTVDERLLTEKAKVLQTCYTPGSHASGIGLTTGGDVAFVSTSVEPTWAIVFECRHGRFIVEDQGKGSRAHKLWDRLKEGQEVTIEYHEKYTEDSTGQRTVVGYKFVDAR